MNKDDILGVRTLLESMESDEQRRTVVKEIMRTHNELTVVNEKVRRLLAPYLAYHERLKM